MGGSGLGRKLREENSGLGAPIDLFVVGLSRFGIRFRIVINSVSEASKFGYGLTEPGAVLRGTSGFSGVFSYRLSTRKACQNGRVGNSERLPGNGALTRRRTFGERARQADGLHW
jgi:hypothetical protein